MASSEQGLVRLNEQEIRERDVRADNTQNIYWRTGEGEMIALPQMTDTHLRNTALMLMGMGYQNFNAPDSVKVLWLSALRCEWERRKAAKQ
jgi:hypothetical protein